MRGGGGSGGGGAAEEGGRAVGDGLFDVAYQVYVHVRRVCVLLCVYVCVCVRERERESAPRTLDINSDATPTSMRKAPSETVIEKIK